MLSLLVPMVIILKNAVFSDGKSDTFMAQIKQPNFGMKSLKILAETGAELNCWDERKIMLLSGSS